MREAFTLSVHAIPHLVETFYDSSASFGLALLRQNGWIDPLTFDLLSPGKVKCE